MDLERRKKQTIQEIDKILPEIDNWIKDSERRIFWDNVSIAIGHMVPVLIVILIAIATVI